MCTEPALLTTYRLLIRICTALLLPAAVVPVMLALTPVARSLRGWRSDWVLPPPGACFSVMMLSTRTPVRMRAPAATASGSHVTAVS